MSCFASSSGSTASSSTDALEMKAISETVGVEEGAVRSIVVGADALCLGHDLFDDSVIAVRDALVGAVRSGRLPEGRLVEAADASPPSPGSRSRRRRTVTSAAMLPARVRYGSRAVRVSTARHWW